MEPGCSSKAANLELQSFGSDGVESMQNNQLNETSGNFSGAGKTVMELGSTSAGGGQPRLDEMKVDNPYTTSQTACVSNDDSNPVPVTSPGLSTYNDLEELVSSPEISTDETSLDTESSDQDLMQLSDLSDSDATPAQPATPFSPLIMEPTQSFSLALAEKMPQYGSHVNQSSYSKHEGSSAQANRLNAQTESSLRPEPASYVDKGKKIVVADDFRKNKAKNHHSNLFPRTPTGIRILDRESTQNNQQQAPSLISNKENDTHRPLASGSQVNQFKGLNTSDPQCYNFILPISPTSSRNQQWNNPMHLLSQVANMANAADSQLQKSEPAKHPLPLEPMPRQFSYQYNQVPSPLGASNSQTRVPSLLGASNSQTRVPSPLGASNSQTRSTMVHEPSLPLSNPILPSQQHHNSELPETPLMPRLQTEKQQGSLNQTTRPNAVYPTAGTTFPSLFLQETMGSTESLLSSQKEQGAAGLLGHARSRIEAGESSPFKRFRREPTIPEAPSAEQVNKNPLALLSEASSAADIANFILNPRPLKNSLYDPMYEELGLPIDPHLRLFLQSKK
ncbi:hypothetical protein V6N13_143419 [Hibiscus sabdariffa]|uniref:Uncharacterized protein n=1 Tax=Hibiscus sabdariffa TaxID=183260 RepID=A0ABR2FHF0_9ROSI